jgi:hypothetical protein
MATLHQATIASAKIERMARCYYVMVTTTLSALTVTA